MSAATSKMYGHRRGNNYNVCTIKYVREKKDPECWKKPCLFPSESFTEFTYLLPASWTEHKDKVKSLVGATLFGAGWAISGMCPGPGLVLGGAVQWLRCCTYQASSLGNGSSACSFQQPTRHEARPRQPDRDKPDSIHVFYNYTIYIYRYLSFYLALLSGEEDISCCR